MATPNGDRTTNGTAVGERRSTRRSPGEWVVAALKRLVFWLAVFLPLAVGGVVLPGLESAAQWRLFAVLATASVVALYLGHSGLP